MYSFSTSRELKNGVTLLDDQNNEVGISKKAAAVGITAVVASRIAMATPGMGKFNSNHVLFYSMTLS